jgi:hypothetical protein
MIVGDGDGDLIYQVPEAIVGAARQVSLRLAVSQASPGVVVGEGTSPAMNRVNVPAGTQRVFSEGVLTVFSAAVFFLLVLIAGSTYAGIRHALPVLVLLPILGGVGIQFAFSFSISSSPTQTAISKSL